MSLKLFTGDIDTIDQRIADKVLQAPGFFKDTPVVVDLTELDVGEIDVDTDALLQRIRKHQLVPIVASVVNKGGELANSVSLPLIEGVARPGRERQVEKKSASANVAQANKPARKAVKPVPELSIAGDDTADLSADVTADTTTDSGTLGSTDATGTGVDAVLEPLSAQEVQYIVKKPQLMARPVRSGQQVYARDTDLIVMGQVGPGAEVIADNHIHVYGPLRGRALCGVSGNTEARIFCQSLEAELVSVAGNFRVLEAIPENLRGKPAQIWLEKEKLNIEPL